MLVYNTMLTTMYSMSHTLQWVILDDDHIYENFAVIFEN